MASSSPTLPMFQLDEVPGAYGHLLRTLDTVDQKNHLRTLEAGINAAENYLDNCSALYDAYVKSVHSASAESRQQSQAAGKPKTIDQLFPSDKETSACELKVMGRGLQVKAEANTVERVGALHEALAGKIQALKELHSLWVSIWDVYDNATQPGSSKGAAENRSTFDGGYGGEMLARLQQLDQQVKVIDETILEQTRILGHHLPNGAIDGQPKASNRDGLAWG